MSFMLEDVTSEQRRQAKAVNFGIIYGIGAWSLSEDINVSPKEAQAFIDRYLSIYPEIKLIWMIQKHLLKHMVMLKQL
jgi:DNA polymerase I